MLDAITQAIHPTSTLLTAPPATTAVTLPLVTDHALLVLLGKFAQHLGLVRLLQAVALPQKTRDHRPQTKLIQFLVGILAGLDYLQDFNLGPRMCRVAVPPADRRPRPIDGAPE